MIWILNASLGVTMIDQAWAGHAGEAGIASLMPHEVMGAVVLLIGLLILLTILTGFCLIRLTRLERRVTGLEASQQAAPSRTPPP
jgi:hypothetical protein